MENNKDENGLKRTYYTDVKGTGVLSVIIFGIITFIIMIIAAHFM